MDLQKTPPGEGPCHQSNASVPCTHVPISPTDPRSIGRWANHLTLFFASTCHFSCTALPYNGHHHESCKGRASSRVLNRGAERRDFRPKCGERARRAWCNSRQVQRHRSRSQRYGYLGQETSPAGMCPAQPHLIISYPPAE
jgi:hypothetical protein